MRWKKSISRFSAFHWLRNSVEMTSVNSCSRLSGSFRSALDLLAVFVGAGGEIRFEPLHALDALDRVGSDRRVRVADVRRRIDVVDRSGYVIFHFASFRYACVASAITCFSGMLCVRRELTAIVVFRRSRARLRDLHAHGSIRRLT